MGEEVIVSPCPFCGIKPGKETPVCPECRLTYGEHARYTEAALVHYAARAPGYDRLAALFAKIALYPVERHRRRAVEALHLREGDTVLDLGCGTGLSFSYLQKRIGSRGRIIALDYTGAMLEQAAKKAEKQGWQNVTLVQGDAAKVKDLVATPVNAALSAFCLSLVPGWQKAIAGTVELLQTGGVFVVLDWRTMKAQGPMRALSPVLEWLTKRYGLADPSVNFSEERPWCDVMGTHLTGVTYQDMHMGTTFLCAGAKG